MSKSDDLATLREELAAVRAARLNVLKNGQSYQIAGSHTSTNATLAELAAEEKRINDKILRLVASDDYATHTYAAF